MKIALYVIKLLRNAVLLSVEWPLHNAPFDYAELRVERFCSII